MKTITLFLFILTFNIFSVKCQIIEAPTQLIITAPMPKIDFRIPIMKIVGRHMNIDRLFDSLKNHAYVFSISLSFNAEGKIDTVYFSDKMSINLKEIIKPSESLSDSLRTIDFKNQFTGKILLLPIIIKRYEDREINNASDFLTEFALFWPNFKIEDKSKQVVFLEPFINRYFKGH
jgi:hypothetical protein